jgi:hypothetical protein
MRIENIFDQRNEGNSNMYICSYLRHKWDIDVIIVRM